jgi:hypothetical protein
MKTEGYWKQRLLQSRERVRTAFDQCVQQFSLGSVGDVGTTQYAGVRGSLVSALMAQAELEEDARRAGVPAGWVRFDWSNYRKLYVPDPINCPSGPQNCVMTVDHPCSVPRLLEELNLR